MNETNGQDRQKQQRSSIDLNCDVGEGFGIYRIEEEEALLTRASSANIACGFHAGDPATMRRTVKLCLEKGVSIGAHPGLPDRQGFGRRSMAVSPDEAYEMTLYQIGALLAFVRSEGGVMRHVKPHGALYNMAAVDGRLARAIAEAVVRVDDRLMLVGLAGSRLIEEGRKAGLRTVSEGFADRVYRSDGTLMPRSEASSVIESPEAAASQAVRMAAAGEVQAADGTVIRLQVETICLHGDGVHAALAADTIRARLWEAEIAVKAVSAEAI